MSKVLYSLILSTDADYKVNQYYSETAYAAIYAIYLTPFQTSLSQEWLAVLFSLSFHSHYITIYTAYNVSIFGTISIHI